MPQGNHSAGIQIPTLEKRNIYEIMEMMGDVRRAPKTPSRKALEQGGAGIMAQLHGCRLYENGYVLYEARGRSTVLWLPSCCYFTWRFTRPTAAEVGLVPGAAVMDEQMLRAIPWIFPVMICGDYRIEANRMNTKSDRTRNRKAEGAESGKEAAEDGRPQSGAGRLVSRIPGPEEAVIQRETIRMFLERLTSKQRRVFLLYFWYGYTEPEIAGQMNITQSSVRDHLRGIRKKSDAAREMENAG